MSSIIERQNNIVQSFSQIKDWEGRYKRIIEMGKSLGDLPDSDKQEKNLLKGCQSQVWLIAEMSPEGKILLRGDSDAMIVKGLVSIVMQVYSNSTPSEILSSNPSFLKSLGFDSNLSPSRANGLNSMLKQIHLYATAFDLLQKSR